MLEEVLLRCLEKEPTWRFQDGNALAHALAQLEEHASGNERSTCCQREGKIHPQGKKPRNDGQERVRVSFVDLLAIIAVIMVLELGLYLILQHL
jgi:hypothetical protein